MGVLPPAPQNNIWFCMSNSFQIEVQVNALQNLTMNFDLSLPVRKAAIFIRGIIYMVSVTAMTSRLVNTG